MTETKSIQCPVSVKQPESLGPRTVRFVISTDKEDRDGDVIVPGGGQFAAYLENPVFLPFHNNRTLPAGRVTNIDVRQGEIAADVRFVTREELERSTDAELTEDLLSDQAKLALNLLHWYKSGFLKAVSIGFIPLKTEPRDKRGRRIVEWEMLELSGVPIGSNRDALTEIREVGDGSAREEMEQWARKTLGLNRGFDEFPAPPNAVREDLRLGLKWHEEGFSGGGLQSSTVRWAERMAGGERPSKDKALQMGSWFARHLAQDGPLRDDNDDPTPRAVAIKLWGGAEAGPAYTRRLYRVLDREVPEGLADKAYDPAQQKEGRRNNKQDEQALEHIREIAAQLKGDIDVEEMGECPFAKMGHSDEGDKAPADHTAKQATEFQDHPLAELSMEWSADAAITRWRKFTGSTDAPSGAYRQGFFWVDETNADNFSAYKLPFVDIVEGRAVAVPRGIFAVAAAMQGARGGLDVPEADMGPLRRHVTRYYQKMRDQFDDNTIVAPWNEERYMVSMTVKFGDGEQTISAPDVDTLEQMAQRFGLSGKAEDSEGGAEGDPCCTPEEDAPTDDSDKGSADAEPAEQPDEESEEVEPEDDKKGVVRLNGWTADDVRAQ